MVVNIYILLVTFFLAITILPVVHSKDPKLRGKAFDFLRHLKGCHWGQTVSGLRDLKRYLKKFGYLNYGGSKNKNSSHSNDDTFDDHLDSAVKSYQENYHLNVTGILDGDTIREMMLPRCGLPDNISNSTIIKHSKNFHMVSHYAFLPGEPRWPRYKYRITYRFVTDAPIGIPLQALRSASSRAFKRWQRVTLFVFQRALLGPGDVEIGFYSGDQEDFDGPGGILAYSSPPPIGTIHYDADEKWSVYPGRNEVDFESVAVHEIGHVLGLGHSSVRDAIMFPKFSYGHIKRDLHADDIEGIRALYKLHASRS